ncbi:MAG: mechanosensitive ion channel family protein [Bryobacteraceae bacterium]|nr:mechanosensitive ion channel family protein [Bryobacteraceae bacterium]
MQPTLDLFLTNWHLWGWPVVTAAVTLFAGWIAKRILFRHLRGWASKSTAQWDDMAVDAIDRPFMLWVLMLALYLAARYSRLPPAAGEVVSKSLLVLLILSITLAGSKLAGLLVRGAGDGSPVATITQNVVRGVAVVLGVVTMLNAIGISITPVLGALGVAGLAVSLGLQDTLANFFAGFYLSLAKQIRVGDFIRMDGTQLEGVVTDINWRSTTLRGLANNLILIPNANLAKANVVNFSLPEPRTGMSLTVSAGYGHDPEKVEALLLDTVRRAAIPGLLQEPPPSVRLTGFGDFAMQFGVNFSVAQFTDQFLVHSELRKLILRRFREEGMEMPLPARNVHVKSDGGAPAAG